MKILMVLSLLWLLYFFLKEYEKLYFKHIKEIKDFV